MELLRPGEIDNKRYWIGLAVFSGYFACKVSDILLLVENGGDAFETAGAYIMWSSILKKPIAAAAVLTLAFGAEIAQMTGYYPFSNEGTYDPKDFLAYGIGVATAAGLEVIISKFSGNKKKLK